MATVLKAKINKRFVDSAAAPKDGDTRIWDIELRGFMLRISSSGRKSYCVKYRVNREQRWMTIGEHGLPWTPEEARNRAREVISEATKGNDLSAGPAARIAAQVAVLQGKGGKVIAEAMRDATIGALFELYFREGPSDKPLKRASSWAVDATSYKRHIKPVLDDMIARDLYPSDLAAWQSAVAAGKTSADLKTGFRGRAIVTGGPSAAARGMRCLSAMISWAIWREILEVNPATKVQKLKDNRRERSISTQEAQRLWSVLDEAQAAWVIAPNYADIIRLIMLTGARRNEITELSWSEVDLERSRLLLPPARTKMGSQNKSRTIILSEQARTILEGLPRLGPYVFMSQISGKPVVGINKVWLKVREIAGLQDVRLHDLRHSFATFAVEDGASLYLVGRALGHANASSTERYAHPGDTAARIIAEKVAGRFTMPIAKADVES
jgi:integrase